MPRRRRPIRPNISNIIIPTVLPPQPQPPPMLQPQPNQISYSRPKGGSPLDGKVILLIRK